MNGNIPSKLQPEEKGLALLPGQKVLLVQPMLAYSLKRMVSVDRRNKTDRQGRKVKVPSDILLACVLQQIHFWTSYYDNVNVPKDGIKRVQHKQAFNVDFFFNSYPSWEEDFCFMYSQSSIRLAIKELENHMIIVTDKMIGKSFNTMGNDLTKWYRVNYRQIEDLLPKWRKDWNEHLEVMKIQRKEQEKKRYAIKHTKKELLNQVDMSRFDSYNRRKWADTLADIPQPITRDNSKEDFIENNTKGGIVSVAVAPSTISTSSSLEEKHSLPDTAIQEENLLNPFFKATRVNKGSDISRSLEELRKMPPEEAKLNYQPQNLW